MRLQLLLRLLLLQVVAGLAGLALFCRFGSIRCAIWMQSQAADGRGDNRYSWSAFTDVIGCQWVEQPIPPPFNSTTSAIPFVDSTLKTAPNCRAVIGKPPSFFASHGGGGIRNQLVIDVGANIGDDYSGPAAKEKGHLVYAFEPVTKTQNRFIKKMDTFGFTVENGGLTIVSVKPGEQAQVPEGLHAQVKSQDRGHIVLFQAAAGNETKAMEIPTSSTPAETGLVSLIPANAAVLDAGKAASPTEVIAVVKLDDIVGEDESVFLFKMDAQGYEPTVLDGAVRILQRKQIEIITFEFWPKGMVNGGLDPKKMLLELWHLGYQCYDWSANSHIKDTRPSELSEFVDSFYDLTPWDGWGCSAQECSEFGLWEELVCVQLAHSKT